MKAGEHCGILCKGIKVEDVGRGFWLGAPGTIQRSNICKVSGFKISSLVMAFYAFTALI